MEFVIPGLILVAVMVYVSTRIKRSAAAAYDAETVETELFSVTKPEGFLAVASPRSPLLFEAYSKEFGTDGRENERMVTATARKSSEVSPPTEVSSEWHIGEDKVVEFRDGEAWVTRRTAATRGGDIVFEIRSIVEPEGENARKIEELVRGFEARPADRT